MRRQLTARAMARRMLWPFTDDVTPRTMGPRDREFIASCGVAATLMGVLYLFDGTARDELFLGAFWPWWWIATGLTIIGYAIWPWSTNLHALSGAALPIACVGRAIVLLFAVLLENVPDDRRFRSIGGVIVWLLLGRLVHRQWRTLMPRRRHVGHA